MENSQKLYCPIPSAIDKLPFDYVEIEPLLEYLFENNRPTENQIFERGTITTIGQLDCCKQDLGAAGAALLSDALKTNQHISSILLGTGGIGNEGAKSVGELISHNTKISTVYLGCNQIEAEGISHLAQALKGNSTVSSLWLKRNPIKEKGVFEIAELLKTNPNIRTLDLVNTLIGSKGLTAIIEVLIDLDYPIKRLYLGGNYLQANDGLALCRLIENNPHLEELLLSVNHLGEKGITTISKGLETNKTLKHLGLASNNISSLGGNDLFEALKTHPNLVKLDLGYSRSTKVLGAKANNLDDNCASTLQVFLRENNVLRFLNLERNLFTSKGLAFIEKGLFQNIHLQKLSLGNRFQKSTKQNVNALLAANRIKNPYEYEVSDDVKVIRSQYR